MRSDAWLGQLDSRLRQQFRFLLEIDRLKTVIRGSRIADGSRQENTAEHSWHLALCATTLVEYAVGPVSIDRIVQMLLIHDIVEIDAGDTPLFDDTTPDAQADSEQLAADRLFGLLPHDQADAFRSLWEEFENAQTPDAKFAKAVDRLQPILLNHVVGGGTWTDYSVDESRERQMTHRIADGAPALWEAAEHVFADAVAEGWLLPAPATA